jgi:hypothetical protein
MTRAQRWLASDSENISGAVAGVAFKFDRSQALDNCLGIFQLGGRPSAVSSQPSESGSGFGNYLQVQGLAARCRTDGLDLGGLLRSTVTQLDRQCLGPY